MAGAGRAPDHNFQHRDSGRVYYIVISGGVFAIIGVFASLTVAGIPLGAVLVVLGISYGLYAWMLDQVFSQRGYYNNGAWGCLS
jgi:hypothetical protein